MKKTQKKFYAATVAMLAVIIVLFASLFAGGARPAAAEDYSYSYGFEFERYAVTYDISADRTMHVREDVTIFYKGSQSTGFARAIPVNAGDRVRSVRVYEVNFAGDRTEYEYDAEYEDGYMYLYITDGVRKQGETRSYSVEYDYAITRAGEGDLLSINAIGFAWEQLMKEVDITIKLPDGVKGGKDGIVYYRGYGSKTPMTDFTFVNNTIHASFEDLNEGRTINEGITFDIQFEEGVLSTRPDFTPYWIIIGGCVLLAILAALRFLKFNKNGLTPVVCTAPPYDMDPLLMGKLIDNSVNKSDISSLIFYWANKGYLKIDMTDKDDIVLIQIARSLPQDTPEYQTMIFNRLFKGGELLYINKLRNTDFYVTVEKATKKVNSENGKLYDGKSMGVAVLFTIIGALIMSLTPVAIALLTISAKLFTIIPFASVILCFIIFALTQTVKYNSLKNKKKKTIILYAVIGVLAAVFTALYVLFVPSCIVEIIPKILLGAVGFALTMLSVSFITRTQEYTEKLNLIVGFREFISSAEKDKLETMLESNPEFYYEVLPYAQVLGVSEIWTEKFKAITITPPSWAAGDVVDTYFDVMIFNSVMRSMNVNMTTAMVNRASSGGLSGGGGGHFGGFGGGGHGGGGGFGI